MQWTKKHKVLNRKKIYTIQNMNIFAYNKQSGYKGYLETIALLSFPPKNATLEVKARCERLLLQGKSSIRHRGKPFPLAASFFL